MKVGNLMKIIIVSIGLFLHCVDAARYLDRRSDLQDVPPVSSYGWSVPLQGSNTCVNATFCTSFLPAPPAGQTLKYLTIARGISNYTCTNRKSTDTPLFFHRETTIWDAAPLLPSVPSEQLFHTLIPQLLDFDYSALKNSSLTCIGWMETVGVETIFEISGINDIPAHVQASVAAPQKPLENLQWAYLESIDLTWNIYRVETAGGGPPFTCAGITGDFALDYASEYWFYHD